MRAAKIARAGLCAFGAVWASSGEPAAALGNRLEVLWDTNRVASLDRVRLVLHEPKLREVAIVHDQPWEGNVCCYHTVFQDGARYRLYYRGANWDKRATHPEVVCYAESDDGIAWRKPDLGLVAFNGSTANNIVWDKLGSHNFAPFLDANPACPPDQKYKALGGDGRVGSGLLAFASADGLRWRPLRDAPVLTKGAFDSQNIAFWDAEKKTYVAYFRDFQKVATNRSVRAIKTCTSADFVTWSEPEWLSYAEGTPDEELYTNAILPYPRAPQITIGFPKRFVPSRTTPWDGSGGGGIPGLSDGLFMSSRDGRLFARWGCAFLRPGLQRERWVNRNNMTAWGVVETAPEFPGAPRELSLYSTENYYAKTAARLRRMTVRQDGFVSAQADEKGGTLTTRPLTFTAQEGRAALLVNLSTSVAGQLRCELRDEAGRPLPGFSLAECRPLYGDGIELPVAWKKGSDVSALAGKTVSLVFELTDADLYAYRFGAVAQDVPVRALELPPAQGNPRNSEGAFVTLKDGRILFVYTRFTGGGGDHDSAFLAGRHSSDGGRTWTREDRTVVANEGGMNVMSVSLLRLQDGRIALFYLLKNSEQDCRPLMRLSSDEGETWGAPSTCIADTVGYYVLNNDRAVQLASGRLVLPVCLHWVKGEPKADWQGTLMCYLSDDCGKTWRRSKTAQKGFDAAGRRVTTQEPGVVELKDGRVMMFIRASGGCQYLAYSSDGGDTWSAPAASDIRSPVSPASIKRLPATGDLLLVWNNHADIPPALSSRRVPLSTAISKDDGRTWQHVRTLEGNPQGWYCYIAIHPSGDAVLLGYCAMSGLAHSRITRVPVSWLYAGGQGEPSEERVPEAVAALGGFFSD